MWREGISLGGRVRLALVELKMILVLISNLLDGRVKITLRIFFICFETDC